MKIRLREVSKFIPNYGIFYHGSTDKNFLGRKGIHVGTKKASTQALESRIGVPVIGEWDGTREYGDTLLAGQKTLEQRSEERGYFLQTGYNSNAPQNDYYPIERIERAVYSDNTFIPFTCKPIVFPVKIIGKMTNTPRTPHSDNKANSMMIRSLKLGNAKSGYFYINIGEDSGSISAVVPNGSFLQIL